MSMTHAHATSSGPGALALDCAAEAGRIEDFLRQTVARRLNRRGLVLGISGGVDSAVCAVLAVKALGAERVVALLMPERESTPEGTARARAQCDMLGLVPVVEDITDSLQAIGCYRRRDEAIRQIFPGYGDGWRHKIVIAGTGGLPHFNMVVEDPHGAQASARMPLPVYLRVVASTNFKQRLRKSIEYHHAESRNYAVLGTPNRLEYELGFFVRGGDGLADVKPIAHLYKTQVYALAAHLGVPDEIRRQPPSTDTYSLPQTQEEFYFTLPYHQVDQLLRALAAGASTAATAALTGLDAALIEQVWKDFAGKRQVAERGLRDAFVIGA